MSLKIDRIGYGQVEPNHLSARYTGQLYAQLPALDAEGKPIAQLENGQFLKYNYAEKRASVEGDGEWLLVFNEEKLYDERYQNHKDYVALAKDFADKTIYPRLLRVPMGDIYTTNTFAGSATGFDVTTEGPTLADGDFLVVNSDGWLEKSATKPATGLVFQVVKEYNLPDMQPAVKIQRIQ